MTDYNQIYAEAKSHADSFLQTHGLALSVDELISLWTALYIIKDRETNIIRIMGNYKRKKKQFFGYKKNRKSDFQYDIEEAEDFLEYFEVIRLMHMASAKIKAIR